MKKRVIVYLMVLAAVCFGLNSCNGKNNKEVENIKDTWWVLKDMSLIFYENVAYNFKNDRNVEKYNDDGGKTIGTYNIESTLFKKYINIERIMYVERAEIYNGELYVISRKMNTPNPKDETAVIYVKSTEEEVKKLFNK